MTTLKEEPLIMWAVIQRGQKLKVRWAFNVFSTKQQAEEGKTMKSDKIIKVKIIPIK